MESVEYLLLILISFSVVLLIVFRISDDGDEGDQGENEVCLGFLRKIDIANEKYRDDNHNGEDTLFTPEHMVGLERNYTCGCNESKEGIYLKPENRPENKKSNWRDSSGNIVEQTYMEHYGDICNDANKCKMEDRPLERCVNDDSCRYLGMVCYKHPSFTNGVRTGIPEDVKGVCILESNIYHLEEVIDTYNMTYCDPLDGGGIDYNCLQQWDTQQGHNFINSERDILGQSTIPGKGLGSPDDISICYHPANEKRTVTSYDEDNQIYVYGEGSECCVPKVVPDNNHQADSLLDALRKNPEPLIGIGEMILFDVLENLSVLSIRTGWKMARTGKNFSEAFAEVAGKRNYIAKGIKGSVSTVYDMLKAIGSIRSRQDAAVKLSKLIKNLASKFNKGLKALNSMRKAAATGIEDGTAAVEASVGEAAEAAATEAAEAGTSEIAAAGAEAAGEKALAKAGEEVVEKSAKKMSAKFLDAIPGIGEVLMAVQLIGMVMDETGYGGYENIINNRDLIETLSEQKEAQFLKMMENLDKNPPYSVDFVETFFTDENHNEGSIWPFNMNEVEIGDKSDCQILVNIIKFHKQKQDMIMQEMFASQIQVFLDEFNDDEFGEQILNELSEISQRDDSNVENDIGDYFTEYLANYIHYHYTKSDAEERDQKIYDYILNKTGLTTDNKYKSETNTGFYYNDNALIYLNKELSSEKYSGIQFTKKAVDLYNRYRNLRKGQEYVVFSKYYLDIAYIENNADYPNNEKYHLKKIHIKDSEMASELNLSRNNPILTKGMAQQTSMNDLVNVCQYGNKLGNANYSPPGLTGIYQSRNGLGVHGPELGNTWLKAGGGAQPFGYPGLNGQDSCRNGCRENYNDPSASEEDAKFRLENYHNRIMSWNYANKSDWKGMGETDYKSSTLIANYQTNSGHHDLVIDHDNRICHITGTYCDRAGNLDRKFNNPYGGDHSNTLNHFDQPYGTNNRVYNDCEASATHELMSVVFGDSLTNTVARWFT